MGQIGEVQTTREIAIPDREPEPLDPVEPKDPDEPIRRPVPVGTLVPSS